LERYLRILPQPTGLLLPFDDNNVVCASLWPASSAATWASPDLTSSHCHCHQRHGHNHSLGQLGSVEEKELEEGEDNPLSWALSARWADFPELTPCLLLQIRTCRAKKSGLFTSLALRTCWSCVLGAQQMKLPIVALSVAVEVELLFGPRCCHTPCSWNGSEPSLGDLLRVAVVIAPSCHFQRWLLPF